MSDSQHLKGLVMQLYLDRKHASELRTARNRAREQYGDCEYAGNVIGQECWHDSSHNICETCAVVLPIYVEYRKAADRAGATLRSLLSEGKRIASAGGHND